MVAPKSRLMVRSLLLCARAIFSQRKPINKLGIYRRKKWQNRLYSVRKLDEP